MGRFRPDGEVFKAPTPEERRKIVLAALEHGLQRIRQRFPGVFQIVVVDHNGSIRRNWTDRRLSQEIIRLLYSFCLSDGQDLTADRSIKESWAGVVEFIGERVVYSTLCEPDRGFFDASKNDDRRYFFYSTTPDFGIFVHARRTSTWPVLSIVDRGNRLADFPSMKDFECGVMEVSNPTSTPKSVVEAFGEFQKFGASSIELGGKLFGFSVFNSDFVLWVSTRENRLKSYSQYQPVLVLSGAVLFFVSSLFLYRLQYRSGEVYFSIRWQLVLFFGYAGGLPIMFLAGASMDYLREKYETGIRETHEKMEQMLWRIDDGFKTLRGRYEILLQKRLKSIEAKKSGGKSVFDLLAKTGEELQGSDLFLHNQNGKVVWTSRETLARGKSSGKASGKFFEKAIQNVIAQINHSKDDKFDLVSLAAEDMGNEENPFLQIRQNMRRIVRLEANGNLRGRMFFAPVLDAGGKAKFLLRGFWTKAKLDDFYVTGRLKTIQSRYPSTFLFAMSFSHRYIFPRNFRFRNEVKKFAGDLFISQGTVYGKFRKNASDYLITGICTKELDSGILFAIKPLRLIELEISRLRGKVWVFNLIMVLFCMFLGFLLSERFLLPIRNLAAGVKAIEERKFRYRLRSGEKDEFGRLAETFNEVIGSLAELDVARIVQESLFPQEELAAGDYRIYGVSHSATQLGGDYFDLKLLPDGRIFFLIGDVSGHGIPAALIMAMAKALVEKECENPTTTEKIMLPFNRLIFKTMKWRRMMTCFMGILDPQANILTLTNAGHNYPFFFRQGEPPFNVEIRSPPLGTSKVPKLSSKVIQMLPGDRIFFYTDGLIEAKSNGAILGYDLVLEKVSRIITFDPKSSCADIIQWHRSLTGNAPQEDDITIAILSRAPAA